MARRPAPGRLRLRLARLADMMMYPLGGWLPRSRNRFAFGHGGDLFAGNSKYLFLWLRLHRPDIEAVWITGDRHTARLLGAARLPVAMRWSARGIVAALRSRVYFVTDGVEDINVRLYRGALAINLWHGVGLKALPWHAARAHRQARFVGRFRAWVRSFSHPSNRLVATTSDLMQAHFAEQLNLPPDCCPQLGYPRLDIAADRDLLVSARRIDRDSGFELLPTGFREVYIYLPTWRDTERPFLDEALPDFAALSAALAERDALLYLKLHPKTMERMPDEVRNIRRWPSHIDFQTYLPELTALITDYSSVLYDYLVLRENGVLLYTFDYARYIASDRTLLYPFEDNVAGVRVSTFDELLAALRSGAALAPIDRDTLEAIRYRFFGGSPASASAAVTEYIERRLALV